MKMYQSINQVTRNMYQEGNKKDASSIFAIRAFHLLPDTFLSLVTCNMLRCLQRTLQW